MVACKFNNNTIINFFKIYPLSVELHVERLMNMVKPYLMTQNVLKIGYDRLFPINLPTHISE
jgi:hypothetical protein